MGNDGKWWVEFHGNYGKWWENHQWWDFFFSHWTWFAESAQLDLLDDSEMPGMPQEQVHSLVVERFFAEERKLQERTNSFGQLGCFNGTANYMKQLNCLKSWCVLPKTAVCGLGAAQWFQWRCQRQGGTGAQQMPARCQWTVGGPVPKPWWSCWVNWWMTLAVRENWINLNQFISCAKLDEKSWKMMSRCKTLTAQFLKSEHLWAFLSFIIGYVIVQ